MYFRFLSTSLASTLALARRAAAYKSKTQTLNSSAYCCGPSLSIDDPGQVTRADLNIGPLVVNHGVRMATDHTIHREASYSP